MTGGPVATMTVERVHPLRTYGDDMTLYRVHLRVSGVHIDALGQGSTSLILGGPEVPKIFTAGRKFHLVPAD